MPIPTGLFSSILVLGVGQGVLLALLLLRRSRSAAHTLLAALMLAYAVYLAQELLVAADLDLAHPRWIALLGATPLLFGPLHYLFARYLTAPDRPFRAVAWLNFLPFVILRIIMLPVTLADRATLVEFMERERSDVTEPIGLVIGGFVALHGLTYMVLTLRLLGRVRNDRSQDADRLKWLRQMTWLALFVWVVVGIQMALRPFGIDISRTAPSPVGLLTGIVVYATGYLGLRRAGNFLVDVRRSPGSSPPAPSYSRSGLSPQAARRYLADLVALMEREKPFRDSSLTLQELADRLDVPRHHISAIRCPRLTSRGSQYTGDGRIYRPAGRRPSLDRW
jgi:hypothetical protein